MKTSFYNQGQKVSNFPDAVLITGGISDDTRRTAELYLPSSGVSCTLPNMPDQIHGHTVESSGLLCGGGIDYTQDISSGVKTTLLLPFPAVFTRL